VRQWVIMTAKEMGRTTTTERGSNCTMNITLMQDRYPLFFSCVCDTDWRNSPVACIMLRDRNQH